MSALTCLPSLAVFYWVRQADSELILGIYAHDDKSTCDWCDNQLMRVFLADDIKVLCNIDVINSDKTIGPNEVEFMFPFRMEKDVHNMIRLLAHFITVWITEDLPGQKVSFGENLLSLLVYLDDLWLVSYRESIGAVE